MITTSEQTIEALVDVITGDHNRAPYRRGIDLVRFFNALGWSDVYENFPARNEYVRQKLHEINGTPRLEQVIRAATDPRHFLESVFKVQEIVDYINEYLKFDGYDLVPDGLFFKVRRFPGAVAKHSKPIKNIIFASTGPKPELVLEDATTNDIRIVKHQEHVLIYDREIGEHGLLWNELLDWWVGSNLKSLSKQSRAAQSLSLVKRLGASLGYNEPEKSVFYTYCNYASTDKVGKLPALIPQVYLHYDPYTMRQLAGQKNLVRQRMDFLLLLPNHVKVVIEIDGKQHYSTDGIADPKLYAEMVAEDRRLKLAGYEVYRFGGMEFARADKGVGVVKEFFERLFELHSIFK